MGLLPLMTPVMSRLKMRLSNYLKTERTGLGRGEIPLDPPFAKGGDTEETPI